MEVMSLLLATMFVAPPVIEPNPEPGMGRDAYGDALPFGAVARYGTLRYRAGFPGCVAFSRDGKTILSGGAENKLHFWETDTGKLVREYEAFSSYNHQFAVSPDGRQLVTSNCNEKEVTLRDFGTGKVVRRLAGLKDYPGILRFSPDGKLVAACETNGGAAVVWDRTTGKELARLQMGRFGRPGQQAAYTLAFSPDGRYLAVADRELMVFEVAGWKHVATFQGHTDHICSIAFTPASDKVITGAMDWTLRVWDFASRKEIRRVANDISGSVAVTRDGKRAIANDQGRLAAWDLETGRRVYRSEARIFANGLVLSDDGTRVVGATWSAVVVYDARTGRCLTPMPVPTYPFEAMAFSPNAKYLAFVPGALNAFPSTAGLPAARDIHLWRYESGQVVRKSAARCERPSAIHIDERREISLFKSSPEVGFELWNLMSGKTTVYPKGGPASQAVFATDGTVYALGTDLVEWSPAGNRIARRIALPPNLAHSKLLLSADERVLLASHDNNGVAKSWSTITGKELSSVDFHKHDRAVAISADGKRFATANHTACLRDVRTGNIVHDFGGEKAGSVSFSPDGCLIAVADPLRGIQLWDAKRLIRLRRLEGHRDVVRDLLFSPDSRYLASVSNDTTILVWDVRKIAPCGK